MEQTLITINPDDDKLAQAFYQQGLSLLEYAEARVILDEDGLKAASNDLTIIREVKKEVETHRKEYLSPFREHVDAVNAAYKAIMAPVEQADKVTSASMLQYNRDLAEIIRKQKEINRKRQEAAREEMELKGELTESLVEVPVTEAPSKTVRGEMGTVSQRDHWQYRIIDEALIPREYLMPDHAALMAAAKKKGEKKVPGIEFYNEPTMARSGK